MYVPGTYHLQVQSVCQFMCKHFTAELEFNEQGKVLSLLASTEKTKQGCKAHDLLPKINLKLFCARNQGDYQTNLKPYLRLSELPPTSL